MFNIANYLEKIQRNISSVIVHKKQILAVIKENIGVVLSEGDIEVRDYVLQIRSSPCVKNKLFMSKEKILSDISISAPGLKIIDIK